MLPGNLMLQCCRTLNINIKNNNRKFRVRVGKKTTTTRERDFRNWTLRGLFVDLVFLFKCLLGLCDLDLSYYLVTADSS